MSERVVSSDGRNTSANLEVILSSSRRGKKGLGRRLRGRCLADCWEKLGKGLPQVPSW